MVEPQRLLGSACPGFAAALSISTLFLSAFLFRLCDQACASTRLSNQHDGPALTFWADCIASAWEGWHSLLDSKRVWGFTHTAGQSHTRPFADDPMRIHDRFTTIWFLDRWFQERERACLIPLLLLPTQKRTLHTLIIQNNTGVCICGFALGEPKEKGYVLRGGSWGFLNRPLQGLELLRIFPFCFLLGCYF